MEIMTHRRGFDCGLRPDNVYIRSCSFTCNSDGLKTFITWKSTRIDSTVVECYENSGQVEWLNVCSKRCCPLLSGLSKWVRQLVRHHDTFTGAMQSLESFSQGQRGAVETFKETQSQAAPQHPSPSTVTSPPPEIIAPLKPFDPQLAPPNLHTEVRAANSESRSSESGIWKKNNCICLTFSFAS